MANNGLTDEQVELEIQRLKDSPEVKLAQREKQVRNRRRKYLYYLRQMEKKGKALAAAGVTLEKLRDEEYLAEMLEDEEDFGYENKNN